MARLAAVALSSSLIAASLMACQGPPVSQDEPVATGNVGTQLVGSVALAAGGPLDGAGPSDVTPTPSPSSSVRARPAETGPSPALANHGPQGQEDLR